MDIKRIFEVKQINKADIEVSIYVENGKSYVSLKHNGITVTKEVNDVEHDLMGVLNDYFLTGEVFETYIDLLNTPNCYYSRGNTDCSKWGYKRVCKQLDYCEKCERYGGCQNVAVLNDRLVEIEGSED